MLIETLFLRLFEPHQSEIKEIVQEIVNIHNGAIFKNGTILYYYLDTLIYNINNRQSTIILNFMRFCF